MALGRIVKNPGAKSIPKLKRLGYKRAGAKYGNKWVLPKGRKPRRPPKPPTIPYSEYSAYPAGQRAMYALDQEQAAHQKYAGQVGDWLGASLRNLTGIDPNQPGYNAQAQQQFQANVAGQVGSALQAAATAVPMAPGATAPGGIVAGNNAFLGQAAREAAAARSSAALQATQAQANLNTMMPNTQAQGIIRAYADMQAGLPGLYAQRRMKERERIENFIEQMRQFDISTAIRDRESKANIALAYAQLGLDKEQFAADQAASQAEAGAPIPEGYVRLPDGRYVQDPTYLPPDSGGGGGGGGGGRGGTSTRDAQGRLRVPVLQEKGWKRLPATYKASDVNKKNWKVTRGADGRLWILPRSGSSGGSSGGGGGSGPSQTYIELGDQLKDLWFGKEDQYGTRAGGGWEDKYRGDYRKAAAEVAYWVRSLKPEFVVKGKGRKVDTGKLLRTVRAVGGTTVPDAVIDILQRGYMVKKPDGWYWK